MSQCGRGKYICLAKRHLLLCCPTTSSICELLLHRRHHFFQSESVARAARLSQSLPLGQNTVKTLVRLSASNRGLDVQYYSANKILQGLGSICSNSCSSISPSPEMYACSS